MLGAIIGDIVASRFESNMPGSKEFDLFAEGCFATGNCRMILALAKAIMEATKGQTRLGRGEDDDFHARLSGCAVKSVREIGSKYPNCGLGGMFSRWVFGDHHKLCDRFGDGAAIHAAPAGFVATRVWDAERIAETLTEAIHPGEERVKGAKATVAAICMARHGALKSEIRAYVREKYYPLDFRIDAIRSTGRLDEGPQDYVPWAIECFLESTSFEDAVRTAVSLGGGTVAAITGAIAEAYYGVSPDMKDKALGILDEGLRGIYDAWTHFAPADNERFRVLTKYVAKMGVAYPLGKWVVDREDDGAPMYPFHFHFVDHKELAIDFDAEFRQFLKGHPEWEFIERTRHGEILDKDGSKCHADEKRPANLWSLDEQSVLTLMMRAFRAERFSEGASPAFFEDGRLTRWLKRLKDIDWKWQSRKITEIRFEIGGVFDGYTVYRLALGDSGAELTEAELFIESEPFRKEGLSLAEALALRDRFAEIHTEYWNDDYSDPLALDGEQWQLSVRYSGACVLEYYGSNAYPENWNELLDFFGIDRDKKARDVEK
ncbi:MAG: ADP-ribosylglycohydrolase family protein [Candidatus Accumulibacter sp.]|nr:ADP-ribosylglycohydrolase family protein [Accumulibacter sp.]